MNLQCLAKITISGFIGIIIAALFYLGTITVIIPLALVSLILAIISILYLIAILSNNQTDFSCYRNNTICLLIGSIGTIIFSTIILSVTLASGSILFAALVGLLVFFFSIVALSTICLIACLINENSNSNSSCGYRYRN